MRMVLGRRARLTLVGCLTLAAGAAGICLAALESRQDDVASLTERLDTLKEEKQLVQAQLRGVKQRQREVRSELAVIDAKLDRAEVGLRRASRDAKHARADIEEASEQCAAAEARLADHREGVSARLVVIYERAEVRPIEVVLEATSLADLANRLYLLDQVVSRDAEMLSDYQDALQVADERRAELEEREREASQLREQIASEKRRTSAKRRDTERRKQLLLRDRAAWEKALAELEQDSNEVETMLQALQRGGDDDAGVTQAWTGKLNWPLRGRISSQYGRRLHPIYRVRKMHTGIDIAASTGTRISAAAPGKVVHAARWGGYGNCVIVDHGGGLATLYAHCSRIAVENGSAVEQGDVVGYVGSTGLATGPHLHFEVRKDGRHVNPMELLR